MSFNITLTGSFRRSIKPLVKHYASMAQDLIALRQELLDNPRAGEALGRDCYKVRMRIGTMRTDKSGGARVITCVKIVDESIYLLTIYDKSEQETLTENERDDLLRENGLL